MKKFIDSPIHKDRRGQYFECYDRFHSSGHQLYAMHPRVYSKLFKIHSGAFVRNHGPPSYSSKAS